jgi:hypothetical protein
MNSITRYANFDSRIVNINYIIEYSKSKGFDLPPSQREKEWVNEQNSKFIHSIFENKPLGSFIFNKRHDKTYILDGQHRINALELFTKDNFGVKSKKNIIYYDGKAQNAKRTELNGNKKIVGLSEEEKHEFLDTEIFIREYKNLSDDEMADIIDSINEGIKNDNVNIKKDLNNDELINNLINDSSETIFNKEYKKIKENDKTELKKYIGYVGTIIRNFDSCDNSTKYTQLNSHHVKHFYNNIKKDTDNIEDLIKDIKNFINVLYSDNLLNHKDTLKITDKYDMNNYYINCIYYKVYEQYNQSKEINNKKIRETIIELIEKYHGTQFRDLMECYDTLYNKSDKSDKSDKIKEI